LTEDTHLSADAGRWPVAAAGQPSAVAGGATTTAIPSRSATTVAVLSRSTTAAAAILLPICDDSGHPFPIGDDGSHLLPIGNGGNISSSSISNTSNTVLMFLSGFFVNGPYALITTAVVADLGTQDMIKGNLRALATVTAIIDGTGSVGAALGPLLTGYISTRGWNSVFVMLILATSLAGTFVIHIAKAEVVSKIVHSSAFHVALSYWLLLCNYLDYHYLLLQFACKQADIYDLKVTQLQGVRYTLSPPG
ncbi:hypothetical protein Taro_005752, partial [Colocasia esculenta]|nr:hypothetical protein [Colocasia esculenta]